MTTMFIEQAYPFIYQSQTLVVPLPVLKKFGLDHIKAI